MRAPHQSNRAAEHRQIDRGLAVAEGQGCDSFLAHRLSPEKSVVSRPPRLGRPAEATGHHESALARFRQTGETEGQIYALNGLVGTLLHARGVARRPGGFGEPAYNLVMGPPLVAPGSSDARVVQ